MLKQIGSLMVIFCIGVSCSAGDFEIIHQFDGVDGAVPYGSVIYSGGKLYGTTFKTSSITKLGTVYALDIDGSNFDVLKSFTDSSEGEQVYNGLTLYGGELYGITCVGGASGRGALFKLGTSGSGFSVVHDFAGGSDGRNPYTAPVVYNNKLYGLTYAGGTNNTGVIYSYDPSTGQAVIEHSFASQGCKAFGGLTEVGGWLYGMTSDNRNETAYGNIFRYNPSTSAYEVLHTFAGRTDGGYPYDSLVWDGGDFLYGTTLGFYPWPLDDPPALLASALSDEGVVFRYNISTGEYSVIHDFAAQSGDGAKPNSSMLIGEDGWLYGIAHGNEVWEGTELGTLYRMQPDGSDFEVLHTFDSMADGDVPMRSLVMVDGVIYGATAYGGFDDGGRGYGTVWSYDTIPEPATIILMAAGLLRIARTSRKK